MDRLATLLGHFDFSASAFHHGSFCGVSRLEGHSVGHVHLLRSGRLSFRDRDGATTVLDEPSLILVIRPQAHQLSAGELDNAELVCATLSFRGGPDNALTRALPDVLVSPLSRLAGLQASADWLFAEAFAEECGKVLVLNRLFELMLIQLLRHLLSEGGLPSGMLAGLADRRLSRALVAMHDAPTQNWTVEQLAGLAGMSRAAFAAHFPLVLGSTPLDYLADWRVGLAQKRMREGRPLALVADEVGYQSASALARVFRRKTGMSPTEWLRASRD